MGRLEQIAKDAEWIQLVSEMAAEEIVETGKRIEEQMIGIHDILGDRTQVYSFSFEGTDYKVHSSAKEFQVHVGSPEDLHSYALYSFIIKGRKKPKCFAATGHYARKGLLTIPENRATTLNSDNRLKSDIPWGRMVRSDRFFAKLAGLYPNPRIKKMLSKMLNLPEALASHLSDFKLEQLDNLGSLETETQGSKKLQEATERIEEKKAVMVLYRKKPEIFKQYFMTLSEKEQEEVCDEIYGLEDAKFDAGIGDWLSEKYPGLVEIVGRDRYIEK